jgi:hypothetical protein
LKGNAVLVAPEEGSFKLLTPTEGMDALTDYTFNTHKVHIAFAPGAVSDASSRVCTKSKDRKSITRESAFRRLMRGKMVKDIKVEYFTHIKVEYFSHSDGDQGRRLADELYSRRMW